METLHVFLYGCLMWVADKISRLRGKGRIYYLDGGTRK